jgi:hypothetical protein
VNENRVKIFFSLEQDEEGYPPVAMESLWAKEVSTGLYEIDNIPFYVVGISFGDLVEATLDHSKLMTFVRLKQASAHSTIRVILFKKEARTELVEKLEKLGCSWEGGSVSTFLSIDIPPEVIFMSVLNVLDEGLESDAWDYEEAAIRHR